VGDGSFVGPQIFQPVVQGYIKDTEARGYHKRSDTEEMLKFTQERIAYRTEREEERTDEPLPAIRPGRTTKTKDR